MRRRIADAIRTIRRTKAFHAGSGRGVADRLRRGTVAIGQTFDTNMADRVAERRVTSAIAIRAAGSVRHAVAGGAVEVPVGALAASTNWVTTRIRENRRAVVTNEVSVGATLVAGQVNVEIAVVSERGAVGAIAADWLCGYLTRREATTGYGDRRTPEHPLENAAPINTNREVLDEPIKPTAIHPSASPGSARDCPTKPPPRGRQANDNRVAPFERNVQVYLAYCTCTYKVKMRVSAGSATSQSVTVASQTIAKA